jgi:triosephosphate isomerase
MKKTIIANFKMNEVSSKLLSAYDKQFKNAKVVLCPPFIYLKKGNNYDLGAQNCFYEDEGAFTGEVSPKMLKKQGVKYVILGHSERRHIIGETNDIIKKKINACLRNKLKIILCIGEKQGEDFKKIIKEQLKGINDGIIIAYEPVWAIGSGKTPTIEDIETSYNFIKKIMPKSKVLYGGSVNSKNSKEILEKTDGVLVGGACLKAKEFLGIINSAK